MENGTTGVIQPGKLIVRSGPCRLLRPRPPDKEERYQRLLALRASNPELFKLEVARMKERHGCRGKSMKEPPEEFDVAYMIQRRRAAALARKGPFPLGFSPRFLTDLREATCVIKAEDEIYKKLVNIDPPNSVLRVFNRKTGLVDEEFTACMIERYREEPGESGTGYEDNLYKKLVNLDPLMSAPKVVNYKTGRADEEFTARKIKLYREDPGESSVTAIAASGIADEVREGISVLKLTG